MDDLALQFYPAVYRALEALWGNAFVIEVLKARHQKGPVWEVRTVTTVYWRMNETVQSSVLSIVLHMKETTTRRNTQGLFLVDVHNGKRKVSVIIERRPSRKDEPLDAVGVFSVNRLSTKDLGLLKALVQPTQWHTTSFG